MPHMEAIFVRQRRQKPPEIAAWLPDGNRRRRSDVGS